MNPLPLLFWRTVDVWSPSAQRWVVTLSRGNGEAGLLVPWNSYARTRDKPLHYLGQAVSPGKGKAGSWRQEGEVFSGTGACAARWQQKTATTEASQMSNSLQVTQLRSDQHNCTELWVPLLQKAKLPFLFQSNPCPDRGQVVPVIFYGLGRLTSPSWENWLEEN